MQRRNGFLVPKRWSGWNRNWPKPCAIRLDGNLVRDFVEKVPGEQNNPDDSDGHCTILEILPPMLHQSGKPLSLGSKKQDDERDKYESNHNSQAGCAHRRE